MPDPTPDLTPGPPAPRRGWLKALGPGIVFAGAAIGVSHLVQSTRAGAVYGLALLPVVLLAHAVKFPALSFGCRYAAATGTSLLEGYRRLGLHALAVFALVTLGTMFTIVAAISLVTASVLRVGLLEPAAPALGSLGTSLAGAPIPVLAGAVLVACAALLACGGYRWLDRAMKTLMVIMLVLTLSAAALVLPAIDWSASTLFPAGAYTVASVGFIVALVGWMPAPLDISVWNSLWTLARANQTSHRPTGRQARADFLVGLGLTIVLACAFVLLGAALLHQRGIEPESGAGPFVAQLISLYTESIGEWVRPVIGVCAFAVMFSTLLTVSDAIPRVLVELVARFRSPELGNTAGPSTDPRASRDAARRPGYWITFAIISTGSLVIVTWMLSSLTALVDLATTLSFLTTPALAWFNHRAMHGPEVPEAHRPSPLETNASRVCLVVLVTFALVYLATVVPAWLGLGS